MAQKPKQRLALVVGANICARRKLKNLTQANFAELLGLGADSLSRIERGLAAPRFNTLERMAALLDCSVADLFQLHSDASSAPVLPTSIPQMEGVTELQKREVIYMAEKIIQLMNS